MTREGLKPEWRRILQHRSTKDKIAVAIDCDLMPVGDLNIVAELVREGVMVWGDRATLKHLAVIDADGTPELTDAGYMRRPNADVYYLTPKGIALCNANGIEQR